MAQYSQQQGRSSSQQREAAYNNIFGPPAAAQQQQGRSQTMLSQPMRPPTERAATMSSQMSDYMQRAPPMRAYPPSQSNPRPVAHHQQSYGAPSPPTQNGDYHHPSQQQNYPSSPQPHRQPQPQYLPQPLRPDRRPYAAPQRLDPRGPPPSQPYARTYTGGPAMSSGPGPALNSDSYRSQSMAATSRPNFPVQHSQSSYNIAPAHAFRQQPYMSNHLARTTAQGRVVPDRPADERTMSMSSYSRDQDHSQIMSGRVIPQRKRGDSEVNQPDPFIAAKGRTPSQGSIQSRSMSMASTIAAPSEYSETTVGAAQSPRPSITASSTRS
ncbi:citron like protein, partial [Aureobasidium melanogenum]